jgi:hypothetical protein
MPMKFDAARSAIYSRLDSAMNTNHPGVPVLYENRLNVDLALQSAPFVACEILFNDGEQVSMEISPVVRYRGSIWLAVAAKRGDGIKGQLTVLATLADTFKTVVFGGVTCHAPRPMPGFLKDGWYLESIRVPFYFNDTP